MELPQSRPFETQGSKKPTHDFLSACSNPTVHPDPMPSSQGEYLKTQDFLQPLERVGTRTCTEEGIRRSVDTTAASSELKSPHVLPGGIGTYTISHIPNYLYHHHNQQVHKSEVSPMFTVSQASSNERNAADENSISHCSFNYVASGFTLWDESLGKRHTRMDNARERTNINDATGTVGQWQGMEQRGSFSSRSSLPTTSGLKSPSQSFMDMIRSAKGSSQEDDLDDDDEEFVMKKENNTPTSRCQRVELRVKVDGKGGNEQKPNTPRSKHSATEQRRRSKINDRFQMLRQLIPNSDQKRDKASFLLEVIEYINFLQEKVNKHEVVPYQRKLMKWAIEGTVPVLADAQAVDMDQQCLNKAMETTTFPMLGQKNNLFSPESSQICLVSSDAAIEGENLREEEDEEDLSVHKGTISISSVYSQGLLKTLTETLQTSGVDLSKASISVQIKLSKQPQKDEEVRRIRPRSQNGDENHDDDDNNIIKETRKQKKLKKDNSVRNI
uniref:Transcription factor BIM1 n=1 Tax=Noccaea caerulescens TaxID=107243 RepID=A0A1J3EBG0_NOCCA